MERRENFSRKRTAILTLLRETHTHPTAEWVYEQLRPKYPDLSLGTVYRNLRLFCEKGQAASIGVLNGQERFDGVTQPHAHFVCSRCGMIRDIRKEFFGPDELSQLSARTGLSLDSASVLFRGLCQNCRELSE